MGWWPFASSPTSRAQEIRSGTAIPTREERLACWASRDAFFACLDANNILDASDDNKEGAAAARRLCGAQSADFERDCAAAWVSYFKKWRVADAQKKRRLEELRSQGAREMEVSSSFAPEGGAGAGANAGAAMGKVDIQDMLDRKRAGPPPAK